MSIILIAERKTLNETITSVRNINKLQNEYNILIRLVWSMRPMQLHRQSIFSLSNGL